MHHHIDSSTCNRKASPFPVRKIQNKKKKQPQNPNQLTTNFQPIPKLSPLNKQPNRFPTLQPQNRAISGRKKFKKIAKRKGRKTGTLEPNHDENRRSEAYSEEDYAIGCRRVNRSGEAKIRTARADPPLPLSP